jgi:hypothetical protein
MYSTHEVETDTQGNGTGTICSVPCFSSPVVEDSTCCKLPSVPVLLSLSIPVTRVLAPSEDFLILLAKASISMVLKFRMPYPLMCQISN